MLKSLASPIERHEWVVQNTWTSFQLFWTITILKSWVLQTACTLWPHKTCLHAFSGTTAKLLLTKCDQKGCHLLQKSFPLPVKGSVLQGAESEALMVLDARSPGWSDPMAAWTRTLAYREKALCLWWSPCAAIIQRGSRSFLAPTRSICIRRVGTGQQSPGRHSRGASRSDPGLVYGRRGLNGGRLFLPLLLVISFM